MKKINPPAAPVTMAELRELQVQAGLSDAAFARRLGLPPRGWQTGDLHRAPAAAVGARAVLLALELEKKNLLRYVKQLEGQPTGPFNSGKILHHWPVVAALRAAPRRVNPVTVEWHLSNVCNQHCPACTFRESVQENAARNRQLFPDAWIAPLVRDLAGMGVQGVVYSGGGEPLAHPRAMAVMRRVQRAGLAQGLITNGTLLRSDALRTTVVRCCDWVRVSADAATPATYRLTHGPDADFATLIANLRALVRTKRRLGGGARLGVSFLLTGENYRDLVPAAKLFRTIGVDYFQVKPIVVPPHERLQLANIFWRREVIDHLAALPALAVPGRYQVYTLGFKFADMILNPDHKLFRRCYAHPLYPTIAADGEVTVCCLMLGRAKHSYGRLAARRGFRALWRSPRRFTAGASVDVRACPVNCKLSETNKVLEQIIGTVYADAAFLS